MQNGQKGKHEDASVKCGVFITLLTFGACLGLGFPSKLSHGPAGQQSSVGLRGGAHMQRDARGSRRAQRGSFPRKASS